jgi:Tol biopolymer transport system component
MRRRSFLFAAGAAAVPGWSAESSLGTIAYIQADGLCIRDLPAQTPRRLVDGTNLKAPRFSPSGKWIAYSQDDVLHVVSRQDGKAIALGEASQAQWLPARDELLLADEAGLKLLTATNGFRTATRQITNASLPAVFIANGTEMVYSDFVTGGRGTGGEPMRTGRLCRLALDRSATSPKVLVSKASTGYIPGLWSGDGLQILYWEDPDFSASIMADGLDLFRIPAAGGPPQRIGAASAVHEDSLALSSDGIRVAISAGGGRYHWAEKRIAVVDLKSGELSYVTGTDIAAVFPSWSPNSNRIAYSTAPSPPGSADAGGGAPAKRLLAARRIWVGSWQLTNDANYRDEKPMWSADGRYILFARIDRQNRLTLWLTEVENPSPVQVAGPLYASEDAWFGYYGYIDWRAWFDWYRQ